MAYLIRFSCTYLYFVYRSLSLGSAEVAKKPKKTSTYGSAGTTVTSKQCKDNSTGLYLETNIDYLQLETYVALQGTKELPTKIKIPGICMMNEFKYIKFMHSR